MHRRRSRLISLGFLLLPVLVLVLCVALPVTLINFATVSSATAASPPLTTTGVSTKREMTTITMDDGSGSGSGTRDMAEAGKGTAMSAPTKTIFLVRHAESDENRRLHSLKTAFKDLTRFALPKSKDIVASCELLRIDQQVDSNVSQFGKQQITYMANVLKEANFVTKQNVQLLVHSPLLRAKETCRDMFGCILSNTSDESSPLLPPQSKDKVHNISEVIELDLLAEMTPLEWIPGNAGSLHKRMRALETWLAQRPETTIVCVGHSQYFKALLQLPYKFQNCDVIRVTFDPSLQVNTTNAGTSSRWSNMENEHLCRIPPPSDDTCPDTNAANETDPTVAAKK